MKERLVLVQNRIWNILDSGSGRPIVFLHNGGGNLWNWAYQIEYFLPKYRIIVPDLLGFGRSERTEKPLSLDFYVENLMELLELLDCTKPILVGNCIGSSIALQLALNNSKRVRALALFNVCGGFQMLNPYLQFLSFFASSPHLSKFFNNFNNFSIFQKLEAQIIYAKGEPEPHSKQKEFFQEQNINSSLKSSLYPLLMGLKSFNRFSETQFKPNCFPPVLLAWGEENHVLNKKWANSIANWLKPDIFSLIKKTGHLPMSEDPKKVNNILENFFAELA